MQNALSLEGASVLVAGASGGLGRALVAELEDRGARCTGVALGPERLDSVATSGPRLAVDLRTSEGCGRAVRATLDHAGRLDVVINATGRVAFGPVESLTVDTLEELFLTNVFAAVMLAQAATPYMTEGGVLVNISGVIAERNLPGMAAYGASKAALRSFDEALARELRRRVRVVDARPPHTETGLVDRALEGTAPRLKQGLAPSAVALTICNAIESGATDLPSEAFAAETD